MGIFRKAVEKIKNFFGLKGQTVSVGKTPSTTPAITKHPNQPTVSVSDMVSDFLYFNKPLVRLSSNVAYMKFDFVNNILRVGYWNGAVWEYGDWKIDDMQDLIRNYQSNGTFVWDRIRVRGPGNKKAHQRPAKRIN